jgi:hypothetical protein
MIMNKHQNVDGLRHSRSERNRRFDCLWHTVKNQNEEMEDKMLVNTKWFKIHVFKLNVCDDGTLQYSYNEHN